LCYCFLGPINTLFVNTVPVRMRARAFGLSIFAIHTFGDAISPSIMGGIATATGIAPSETKKKVLYFPRFLMERLGICFLGSLLDGVILAPITMGLATIVWLIGWRWIPEMPLQDPELTDGLVNLPTLEEDKPTKPTSNHSKQEKQQVPLPPPSPSSPIAKKLYKSQSLLEVSPSDISSPNLVSAAKRPSISSDPANDNSRKQLRPTMSFHMSSEFQEKLKRTTVSSLSERKLTDARQDSINMELVKKIADVRLWLSTMLPSDSLDDDLSQSLQNGVILCKLIQVIKPAIVLSRFHEDTKLRYKALENIDSFLNACRTLGVSERALFLPMDLYENKNFPRVIHCILALKQIVEKLTHFGNDTHSTLSRTTTSIKQEKEAKKIEEENLEETKQRADIDNNETVPISIQIVSSDIASNSQDTTGEDRKTQ